MKSSYWLLVISSSAILSFPPVILSVAKDLSSEILRRCAPQNDSVTLCPVSYVLVRRLGHQSLATSHLLKEQSEIIYLLRRSPLVINLPEALGSGQLIAYLLSLASMNLWGLTYKIYVYCA